MDTPIPKAERVVSAGKGIGEKKNMKLVEGLAKAAGAAIGGVGRFIFTIGGAGCFSPLSSAAVSRGKISITSPTMP